MEHPENLFTASASVRSDRLLCTPSTFARTNLLYLQEAGRLTALAPHTSRREKLNSFLCFVVLEGRGALQYGGQDYPLRQGDVVFIDCRRPYAHRTDEQQLWTLQWCHFYGAAVPDISARYCERGGAPVFHPKDAALYTGLLSALYETRDADHLVRDMQINETLGALLTHLMRESWHPERCQPSRKPRQDMGAVKAYLDEHYPEELSLERMAELFFLNKHYLARLFKQHYGVTLNGYLQQVRITHAKMLLRFTDKKIEAIGLECGFGELTYFSRVFKKVEGVSPREYRRLWQSAGTSSPELSGCRDAP